MEPKKASWKTIAHLRMIFFCTILFSGFAILYFLPRITIPLALAFLLHLILHPIMLWLERLGVKRGLSALMIVMMCMTFVIYPITVLVPKMIQDVDKIERQVPDVENFFQQSYIRLKEVILDKTGHDIGDRYAIETMEKSRIWFKDFAMKLPLLLGNLVEWLFVVPLFLFFLLRDSRSIRDGVLRIVPNAIFEKYYNLTFQFNRKLGDYIFAKFIEATIVGTLITVGLIALDIRFAVLFGSLAAITNIIPYVGPVLGAIPALIYGIVAYGASSPSFVGMLIVFLVANAIDLAIVFPLLVSKLVDLHPAVVVISVILGSHFMGMTGMIISVPVAAAVKLILVEIYNDLFVYGRRL